MIWLVLLLAFLAGWGWARKRPPAVQLYDSWPKGESHKWPGNKE